MSTKHARHGYWPPTDRLDTPAFPDTAHRQAEADDKATDLAGRRKAAGRKAAETRRRRLAGIPDPVVEAVQVEHHDVARMTDTEDAALRALVSGGCDDDDVDLEVLTGEHPFPDDDCPATGPSKADVDEAVRRFQAELDHNAPAIAKLLDEPIPSPANEFHVGQAVEVHAFGHWYRGEIVKIGPKRVTVRYTTGTGRTRDKAVNPNEAGRPMLRVIR